VGRKKSADWSVKERGKNSASIVMGGGGKKKIRIRKRGNCEHKTGEKKEGFDT